MRDSRKAYHHGDLRRALVAAARDLLRREGPAAVSLREAARQAGVSHNAPYRHFASREALLASVAAQGFEDLRHTLTAASAAAPDRKLTALGQAYIRFAVTHRADFRLMFGSEIRKAEHTELKEAATAALEVLRNTVGADCEASDEAAVLRTWGVAHGLAHLVADEQISLEAACAALDASRESGGGGEGPTPRIRRL